MTKNYLKQIDDVIAAGPFAASWESLADFTVPEWYTNAKFGIFIHWGVYAVPAFGSEWYSRQMYQQGSPEFEHHVATYGPQNRFGYKDFIPMLTAEKFDPDAWADLFKRSGARYIAPVAEHHDGFAMYDCSFSDWTAVKMGPRRDIIAELVTAVRRQGLRIGISSHRAEHWWFFDGGMQFESDVQDPRFTGLYGPAQPEEPGPDQAFLEDWLVRTCELVDKFQPPIVWFDWWIEKPAFAPYLQKFAAYYYNRGVQWGQDAVITYKNKAMPEGTGVLVVERGQLKEIRSSFWEMDTIPNTNSWGYVSERTYKPVSSLIGDLVDAVSKNGSMVLNIGPRPDGTIPEEETHILLEIGKWLAINGEAIYDTRPWRLFGEGPTEIIEGMFNDEKRSTFTSEDIRFTSKDDVVYATILAWPENGVVTITSLAAGYVEGDMTIGKVEVLGNSRPVRWTHGERGLIINLSDQEPSEYPIVLKIQPIY